MEVFCCVREVATDQREALIAAECEGDEAVMSEVRSLLLHDVDESTLESWAPQIDLADPQTSLECLHPESIGGFELVGVLGQGGMGVVYRAKQRAPDRSVALKVFRPGAVSAPLVVSIATGVIGYFYAYAIYRSGPRMRAFLIACAVLPLWTSLLVRSFAWTVILRDTGIINWLLISSGLISQPIGMMRTQFAVTVGMIQILLPFVILPAYASMTRFDPGLLSAARSLGADARAAFWAVFFPATRVGLVAGLVLVFVLSLGYYITPVLLGGPEDQPVAVLIDAQVTSLLDWGAAGAMSAIVTAAVLAMLAVGWGSLRRVLQ